MGGNEVKEIKIEENTIITLENGIELLLLKQIGEMFIAKNYSNLCDDNYYIVEQIRMKNGDVCVNVIHNVKEEINDIDQLKKALQQKNPDGKTVEIMRITTKEEMIVQKMRIVLEDKDLSYKFDGHPFPCFTVPMQSNEVKLTMTIEYAEGHIMYRVSFPIEIHEEYKLLAAIYICNYNRKNPFKWNLDYARGLLSMRYSYDVDEPEFFEAAVFGKFIREIFESIFDQYSNLKDICKGNVSKKRKDSYAEILRRSLNMLLYNENNKGRKACIHEDNDSGPPNPFKAAKMMTGIEEENPEDGAMSEMDLWIATDRFIDQLAKGGKVPSFEEFMKMRADKKKREKTGNRLGILPFEDVMKP